MKMDNHKKSESHEGHGDHEKEHAKHDEKKHTSRKERNSRIVPFSFDRKRCLGILLIALLILIPMAVSFYYRIQPSDLPIMDDQAYNQIIGAYKNEITNTVNKQYSYLPEDERQKIIDQNMKKFLSENGDEIKETIIQRSELLKDQLQDENGDTYLLGIDPWMQYKYTKNYLETGTVGDKVIDGVSYTTLRYGTAQVEEGNRFHPWIMSKIHKILNWFGDYSLLRSVFLFPLIWVTLSVIPAFFIGRRLSNNFGGFVAAMIIASHQFILSRTIGGFSDTDAHNVFFPLFIIWFVVEAMSAKEMWKKLSLFGLAGITTGIYSVAWAGWWYVFDFILFGLIGIFVLEVIRDLSKKDKAGKGFLEKMKSAKDALFDAGAYLVSSFIGVTILFMGFMKEPIVGSMLIMKSALTGPIKFISYQEVGVASIWPNVLTTVAELNNASISKVIGAVTGEKTFLFLLALIGLVLVIKKKDSLSSLEIYIGGGMVAWYLMLIVLLKKLQNPYLLLALIVLPIAIASIYAVLKNSSVDYRFSIIMGIFFAGTFLASVNGIRFVALHAIPYALCLGISAGMIYKIAKDWLSDELSINKMLSGAVLSVLLLLAFVSPHMKDGWDQSLMGVPSYNDSWDKMLDKVNTGSEDAIITSWWDFGHWFVAGSERRVTFDGGDQGKRIHWVGRSLLTDNETEALSILRMLDCGHEESMQIIESFYGEEYKAVKTMKKALALDREKAFDLYLSEGMKKEDAEKLIELTHCTPEIDHYFIASRDMIGKSGVWAHFGIWDFERAYLFNSVNKMDSANGTAFLKSMGYSDDEARKLQAEIINAEGDRWISPWPGYISDTWSTCITENETTRCVNGLVFDHKTEDAYFKSGDKILRPKKIAYYNNGKFRVKEYLTDYIEYGFTLHPTRDGYGSIGMSPELTASVFTRLYFFGGLGLKHFEGVDYQNGIDGVDMFLYKVDVNGGANVKTDDEE